MFVVIFFKKHNENIFLKAGKSLGFGNMDIHVVLQHMNHIRHSDYKVLMLLNEDSLHISYIWMQFQHIILFLLLLIQNVVLPKKGK